MQLREINLLFRPSTAADVVAYEVRVRPAGTAAADVYDEPFERIEVASLAPPTPEGKLIVPLTRVAHAVGLEGTYDVHVNAVDSVGHRGDFLELDNQVFDISPPDAPTDGSIEYGGQS